MAKLAANTVILSLSILLSACGAHSIRNPGSDTRLPTVANSKETELRPAPQQPPVNAKTLASFEGANRAIAAGDWSAARAALHALVDSRPDLSGPCLNLALVYQQQGDSLQAEKYYQRALQINPDNLVAHNQYAIFLREQGRFSEAEHIYLQALAVWEAHADTHRNIGVLYDMYMGDHQQALQHFNRYQHLTGSDDSVVAGWIADLQRQLPSLAQGGRAQ
jgi:Tfp pilus assembly protein PilF